MSTVLAVEPPFVLPAPQVDRSRRTGVLGIALRLIVGVVLCLNPLTAFVVLGWLTQRTPALVLKRWWRASPQRRVRRFADLSREFGREAPSPWPRWLLADDVRRDLRRPTPRGDAPGFVRKLVRLPRALTRGLAANLAWGFSALLATSLLAGWGCALMTFGWEYGWLNSFTKGYEQHYLGALVSWVGVMLLTAALVVVPTAQVHQAVVGRFAAFFDLRLLLRLLRSRPLGHLGLAIGYAAAGGLFEILKSAPAFFPQVNPALETVSDREVFEFLRQYYLGCAIAFFPTLLLLRSLAARVYAASVLAALRQGRLTEAELPAHVVGWLDVVEVPVAPVATQRGLLRGALAGLRTVLRGPVYVLIVLVWLAFVLKVYLGEFLHYHPGVGFLNHPFIQLPYISHIPDTVRTAEAVDPP